MTNFPQKELKIHKLSNFTQKELKIQEIFVPYDLARKAEGYSVGYRRWAHSTNIADGSSGKRFGEHVETLYLHPSGKALLVKITPDGTIGI